MDYLSLLLAAFLTAIIYLFWIGVKAVNGQYLEEDDDWRAQFAHKRGWYYESYESGLYGAYKFHGETPSDRVWELHLSSGHTGGHGIGRYKLVWNMAAIKSQRKEFEISSGIAFETWQRSKRKLAAYAAIETTRVFGKGATYYQLKFLQNARFQPLSPALLQRQFKAMARDPYVIAHFITPEIEALLLRWPKTVDRKFAPSRRVSIHRDTNGLRIECLYADDDLALCEHIIKLGLALAERV